MPFYSIWDALDDPFTGRMIWFFAIGCIGCLAFGGKLREMIWKRSTMIFALVSMLAPCAMRWVRYTRGVGLFIAYTNYRELTRAELVWRFCPEFEYDPAKSREYKVAMKDTRERLKKFQTLTKEQRIAACKRNPRISGRKMNSYHWTTWLGLFAYAFLPGYVFGRSDEGAVLDAIDIVTTILVSDAAQPVEILRNTFSDQALHGTAMALGSSFLLSALRFIDRFVGGRVLRLGSVTPRPFRSLSPNKSLGGYAFGFAVVTAVNVAGAHGWPREQTLFVCVLGALGDLYASALKRRIGVKDFGSSLGSHGGMVDRFDGCFFCIAVLFLLEKVSHVLGVSG